MIRRNALRIVSAIGLAALLLTAAACGGEQDSKERLTAGQIAEKLAEQAEAQGLESAAEYMDVFYSQVDLKKVEEYEALSPMMNVKASEIAVFRVKAEEDVPEIQQALEQRAQDVQTSFERYLEDQYEIAKKAEVRAKGRVVCLIIDENAAELAETFEEIA